MANEVRFHASLDDDASKGFKKIKGEANTLGPAMGRASADFNAHSASMGKAISGHVSKGIGSAVKNAERGGLLIGGALVAGVALGVRALAAQEKISAQTTAVLKSTRMEAGLSGAAIASLANKYEDLNATIDNKVIQSGENVLLTFTSIRKQAFEPALKAALDMNQAMGGGEGGLQGTIIQVGKALQDPIKGITALSRVGVNFSAQQKQQIKDLVKQNDLYGAQQIILKELGKEFGGSFAAAGNTAEGTMAAVKDAVEELEMALARALLPVLKEVGGELKTALSDPKVIKGVESFGKNLAQGAREGIKFLKGVDWHSIGEGLKVGGQGAKMVIDAFLAAPPWLQGFLATGFVANKFTGGAVMGIVGELGKGLIKGVLGMNAGVVNIRAGVVNGVGGVAGAGEGLGFGAKVAAILGGAGIVVALAGIAKQVADAGDFRNERKDLQGNTPSLTNAQALALQIEGRGGMGSLDRRSAEGASTAFRNEATSYAEALKAAHAALDAGRSVNAGKGYTGPEGKGAGYRPADAVMGTADGKGGLATVLKPALDQLHHDFRDGLRNLADGIKNNKPQGAAEAATQIAEAVAKGVGSVSGTKDIVRQLQEARKAIVASGDKAALKQIDAAIRKVESKIPGREWVAKELAQGDKILHSQQTIAQKTKELTAIQASLKAHGDTVAAGIIAKHIESLKPHIDSIAGKINVSVTRLTGGTGVSRPGGGEQNRGSGSGYHDAGGGKGGGRASGGPVMAGVAYTVGERGSETFVPKTDGTIIPHGRRSQGNDHDVWAQNLRDRNEPGGDFFRATAQNRAVRQADYLRARNGNPLHPNSFRSLIPVQSGSGPVRFNPNAVLDPSQVQFVRGVSDIGQRGREIPASWLPKHAKGLLGMTQGATDIGIAGEAGGEAVAILRNPQRIQSSQSATIGPMDGPRADFAQASRQFTGGSGRVRLKAAFAMAADILKGVGNIATTERVLKDLEDERKSVTGTERKHLDAEIAAVKHKLAYRKSHPHVFHGAPGSGVSAVAVTPPSHPGHSSAGELNVNVNVSSANGIITPGAARDIMATLGPLITAWLQRQGIIGRVGTPLRG